MRKEVITHQDPKSPISEIFKTLRTNIQFMSTKGKLKTILVTSTLPGEGKSWVSSNLAVTFAQAGKRVVLIDADMRKGRQYTIFGVSPRPGLSNYLSGIIDNEEASDDLTNYIQETEIDNLYLISAGNIPPNPSELLIAPQMVNLLEQLKDMCDVIIIDGTPSQLVTDSLILTRLVDSTIIVTANKQTKKEDLKKVKNNIQNDALTFKFSKKHYYFFHTKDLHGSHVVIDSDVLDEPIIRLAANIAAYYSKGRYSSSVPVNYCQIKDTKKIPGAKPGKVSLSTYKTIYIDPDEELIKNYLPIQTR